jgi:5-methyltetrahydropteroyltriglutamate--homocysteine methyltransferase
VGSLLRSDAVKDARSGFAAEAISAEALKAVEDAAIVDLVRMQEEIGLKVVTDGETRRSFWHYDFMDGLDGFAFVERDVASGHNFKGADHPMLGHFRYLASIATVTPKISIPGPSCCHFRVAQADIGWKPYRDDVSGPRDWIPWRTVGGAARSDDRGDDDRRRP